MITGTFADTARALIAAATLAPSSHNTQPWHFEIGPDFVDLLADRARALPVNDPQGRELTISCGAALMNLRIAAARSGLPYVVKTFPRVSDPACLARVQYAPARAADRDEAALYSQLPRRRTYRKRFAPVGVTAEALDAMQRAAAAEGAVFRVLDGSDLRAAVARLVDEGDAEQWRDPEWRRELAAWMHPPQEGDGLTVPALVVPLAQFVVRAFDMGHGVGGHDRALADAAPLLATVETDGDSPTDWLMAGQALQRVLLTGCQYGVQASYLNQPVQVAALRARLRTLIGARGAPQVLLRMGRPLDRAAAAPRRPLRDVVVPS